MAFARVHSRDVMTSPTNPGLSLVLAQSRQAPIEIWIWLGILLVLTLVAGGVILALRRRLLGVKDADQLSGSMLDDLREMRARGEISEEEYDYTRKTIAARAAGREPPPRPDSLRSPAAPDGAIGARPGYDLTGERLPDRAEAPERPGDAGDHTPDVSGTDPRG